MIKYTVMTEDKSKVPAGSTATSTFDISNDGAANSTAILSGITAEAVNGIYRNIYSFSVDTVSDDAKANLTAEERANLIAQINSLKYTESEKNAILENGLIFSEIIVGDKNTTINKIVKTENVLTFFISPYGNSGNFSGTFCTLKAPTYETLTIKDKLDNINVISKTEIAKLF